MKNFLWNHETFYGIRIQMFGSWMSMTQLEGPENVGVVLNGSPIAKFDIAVNLCLLKVKVLHKREMPKMGLIWIRLKRENHSKSRCEQWEHHFWPRLSPMFKVLGVTSKGGHVLTLSQKKTYDFGEQMPSNLGVATVTTEKMVVLWLRKPIWKKSLMTHHLPKNLVPLKLPRF